MITLIYTLSDPRTGEIRYVGKTMRTLELRLIWHLQSSYNKKAKSYLLNWVRSLRAKGLRPVIELLREVAPGEDWQAAERGEIARFRAAGFRLVNGTDGGEGVPGRKWSPNAEQRKRMGAAQIGKRASEETRLKRSQSLKRHYAADPVAMEQRREFARKAAKSPRSRKAASARMTRIWSDPAARSAMSAAMKAAWARRRATA